MKNFTKTKFKILSGVLLCFTAIAFISCSNFLKNEEIKKEIIEIIDYNNALTHTINVEALRGSGTIKTPATGEISKKVTDTFTVRFEPADDHKFIKWEAVVKDLASGEKASDYISFENPESLETKVTFKKASSKIIVIQPVCPARLTYTLEQDSSEVYPRDTSVAINFNQTLASECTASLDWLNIQNLEKDDLTSNYFSTPLVDDTKIIFPSDTSNGYIPVAAGAQRGITVKIPKSNIWYVCNSYSEPVKVYLDSDINEICYINSETSKKTKIKYVLKQKNEQMLGILKINGEEPGTKEYEYSVGTVLSVRYKLPDNYTFREWSFLDQNGNVIPKDQLKITSPYYEDNADTFGYDSATNVAQMSVTIYNPMEQTVTLYPQIYDPVKIVVAKGADSNATFKVDDLLLTQENTEFECGLKKSISLKYKYSDAYKFYGWKVVRQYTQNGTLQNQTVDVSAQSLGDINFSYYYDDNALTNGLDSKTNTALITFIVQDYIDGTITITPDVRPIPISKIKIDGQHGKFSPAKDTYDIKEGSSNSISFEPDSDYGFVRWKVYNALTGDEIPNQNYITFENSFDENTSFTLVNSPEENLKLAVKPYVAERPQLLSYWPVYDAAAGSRSDTTVEIVFDRNMDRESILYSDDEKQYLEDAGAQLLESPTDKGRYCGYIDADGETFYKGIKIEEKREGKNIAKYFGKPTFEDAATLFIPVVEPDSLKAGMIIIVTISKDFYYTKEGVPISMNTSEKWRYLANGGKDTNRPTVSNHNGNEISFAIADWDAFDNVAGKTEPVIGNDGSGLGALSNYFLSNGSEVKFTLNNIAVSDTESYPTTMFTLVCTRIFDEHFKRLTTPEEITKTFDYDFALGQSANYSGTHKLENLNDGVYAVTYRFRDRSGNIRLLPDNGAPTNSEEDEEANIENKAFYFAIDTHSPDLAGNISEVVDSRESESVTIAVPALAYESNDIKTKSIKYKLDSASSYTALDSFPAFGSNIKITGLTPGSTYNVKVELEDYSGKTYAPDPITVKTKPEAPSNLTATSSTDNSIRISWSAPTSTNFANYKVYYKVSNTNAYSTKTVAKGTTSCELTGLSPRKKYDIYVVTEFNGIQSPKATIDSNPITKPAAATITNMKAQYDNTNSRPTFEITWTRPSGSSSYDTLKLFISDSENFDSNSTDSFDITRESSNKYTITNIKGNTLTKEKLYYTKIVSSATVDSTVVTKDSGVKNNYSCLYDIRNLKRDDENTTRQSIRLKWDTLSGNTNLDSGVYIYNYATQSVIKTVQGSGLTSCVIGGLTSGTTYKFGIKRYRITDGNVSESDIVYVETCTYGPPVGAFNVSTDSTSYRFSWNRAKDDYDNFKLYAIKGDYKKLLAELPIVENLFTSNYPTFCEIEKTVIDEDPHIYGEFYFVLLACKEGDSWGSPASYEYFLPIRVKNFRIQREGNDNKVTITWDKFSDIDGIRYKLFSSQGNSQLSEWRTYDNTVSLPLEVNHSANTRVNYRISLFDSEGHIYETNDIYEVSVEVTIPTEKVTNVRTIASGQLGGVTRVTWNMPSTNNYHGFYVVIIDKNNRKVEQAVFKDEISYDHGTPYVDVNTSELSTFGTKTVYVSTFCGSENGAMGINLPASSN